MHKLSPTLQGVGFLVLGMLIFSLQDVAVKWIGGDYPVLEIVAFRSLVALPLTLLFFRFEGGRGLPTTRSRKLEYIRGLFYFLSYTTHFMGLAALPLADIAAIKFSAPLMITLLSVAILGERVGPRRWLALLVGFLGVLLIVRPGLATFNLGSIFILLSVLFYALAAILTRKLQTTESSATMAYYSSLVYLLATAILTPPVLVIGDIANAHPSIAFLFRPWTMPSLLDWLIMSGLGLVWAAGMYSLARAYSMAPASTIAPFEYVALPIHITWGFVLWQEIPTWLTLAGAALALGSGLYILYRERRERSVGAAPEALTEG
ncbi:MAG: DMT family transporter [Caldilineaceae bacterium]|nr:DMT family transporter [Caldilineaceae bacterium]